MKPVSLWQGKKPHGSVHIYLYAITVILHFCIETARSGKHSSESLCPVSLYGAERGLGGARVLYRGSRRSRRRAGVTRNADRWLSQCCV